MYIYIYIYIYNALLYLTGALVYMAMFRGPLGNGATLVCGPVPANRLDSRKQYIGEGPSGAIWFGPVQLYILAYAKIRSTDVRSHYMFPSAIDTVSVAAVHKRSFTR